MDSYTTKLAVRDSLDDDDLSDVDDEVFIRDGKNSSKLVEDRGVKRPLMAPRRKVCKEGTRIRHPPCRIKCVFYCYAAIALLVLLGLIGLTILLVSLYPLPVDRIRPWFSSSPLRPLSNNLLRPCTSFRVTNIWNITIPKLSTESPIRSIDVNQDGVKDIILGFQTENGEKPFPYLCLIYFPKQMPCQGGVMALNGINGTVLWEHWTAYPVYYLDCTGDLNGDNNLDCIAMGRGGLLCAINGLNGTLIWQFNTKISSKYTIDFTVGQVIPDHDGDGIVDILAAHTIQKGKVRTGHLLLISGKTGKKVVELPTPKNKEIYFMPQLIKRNIKNPTNNFSVTNSTQESTSSTVGVLFGTGGQETPGDLYIIPLNGFSTANKNLVKPILLYQDHHKGLLSPAVLVDITGDFTDDIIFVTFNGSVIAMDGVTYKQIWNYTFNYSESAAAIVPGYFNDDNITDFMVKFNVGNGFPEYFYSQTLLLDGKTGTDLLHKWVIDSAPNDLAGLSISVQNTGLDIFLYWIGVCKGYEDSSEIFDEFNFVLGNSIWAESRVDICRLRFNTTLILKLYALNQYEEPPGLLVYSTENVNYEYNASYSALHEAKKFLDEHPKFQFSTVSRQSLQHGEVPVSDLLENMEENSNQNLYQNTKININNGGSNFRHKIPGEGLIREFNKNEFGNHPHGAHARVEGEETLIPDEWSQDARAPLDWSVNDQYPQDGSLPLEPNLSLPEEDIFDEDVDTRNSDRNSYLTQQNREARSKEGYGENQKENQTLENKSKRDDISMEEKQNEIDEDVDEDNENIDSMIRKRLLKDLSMYDEYTNIQNSRNRLLHDLSNVPSAILRQSYLDNAQKNLNAISDEFVNKVRNRNSKFEQRDLRYRQNYHMSSVKKQLETMYDEKRRESLWDLESEKEEDDRAHGYWRGKREMADEIKHVPKIDSTGVLLKPLRGQENSIDYVFAKFWMPVQNEAQILLPADKECVAKKLVDAQSPENQYYNIVKSCLESRGIQFSEIELPISGNSKLDESPYLKDVIELSLGQLTVQRINIQCDCGPLLEYEVCGQILPIEHQRWSEYMGPGGKGNYPSWNKILENSNTYV